MKFFVITFCLIFFSSLQSHSATYEWGQFNGWDVGVNQETNFGCYVLSPSYEDGSVIKLGFINLEIQFRQFSFLSFVPFFLTL